MLTIRSPVFLLLLLLGILFGAQAAPQRRQRGGNGRGRDRASGGGGGATTQQQTAQQQAAQVDQGVGQAADGSMILDMTADINGLPIRFRVSGPADQFTEDSGVPGAAATANTQGTLGLNVLLHGDGGASFFEYPNQGVQNNLAGVAVLAPDENLFWGGGNGLDRTDGVEHAQAVNDLITQTLPQVMAFNASNVFFTGVSGGSLLLSGFFVPAHMANFAGTGVLLNCGGMPPQVDFVGADAVAAGTRLHFQSTQRELALLQGAGAIPDAVAAYEQLAADAGLNAAQINALQTVDNSPDGGHCEFDELEFNSGIQLIQDSFANIMQGGDGEVAGLGNVNTGVVGNEDLVFSGAS